jgi:hypothetical protein
MTNTHHDTTDDFGCAEALPLVPSYLDGELSEARAGLLRKHLLDCSPCRTSAQDAKALSRWFAHSGRGELGARPEFAPPAGFAARVARRAFAGDVGVHPVLEREAVQAGPREGGKLLQFVLGLTAAAAAVMLVAAVALRDQSLPADGRLRATNQPPSKESVLLRLEALDRAEAKGAPGAAPGTAHGTAPRASPAAGGQTEESQGRNDGQGK